MAKDEQKKEEEVAEKKEEKKEEDKVFDEEDDMEEFEEFGGAHGAQVEREMSAVLDNWQQQLQETTQWDNEDTSNIQVALRAAFKNHAKTNFFEPHSQLNLGLEGAIEHVSIQRDYDHVLNTFIEKNGEARNMDMALIQARDLVVRDNLAWEFFSPRWKFVYGDIKEGLAMFLKIFLNDRFFYYGLLQTEWLLPFAQVGEACAKRAIDEGLKPLQGNLSERNFKMVHHNHTHSKFASTVVIDLIDEMNRILLSDLVFEKADANGLMSVSDKSQKQIFTKLNQVEHLISQVGKYDWQEIYRIFHPEVWAKMKDFATLAQWVVASNWQVHTGVWQARDVWRNNGKKHDHSPQNWMSFRAVDGASAFVNGIINNPINDVSHSVNVNVIGYAVQQRLSSDLPELKLLLFPYETDLQILEDACEDFEDGFMTPSIFPGIHSVEWECVFFDARNQSVRVVAEARAKESACTFCRDRMHFAEKFNLTDSHKNIPHSHSLHLYCPIPANVDLLKNRVFELVGFGEFNRARQYRQGKEIEPFFFNPPAGHTHLHITSVLPLTPFTVPNKKWRLTACTKPLYGMVDFELKFPGLLEFWILYHRVGIGLDHFVLYDSDGTFVDWLDLLTQEKKERILKLVEYVGQFNNHVGGPDFHEFGQTKPGAYGNGQYGQHKKKSCRRGYIFEPISKDHCAMMQGSTSERIIFIHGPDSFLFSPSEPNADSFQNRLVENRRGHSYDWLMVIPSIYYQSPDFDLFLHQGKTYDEFLVNKTVLDLLQSCKNRATNWTYAYHLVDPLMAEFMGFHSATSRVPDLDLSAGAFPNYGDDHPLEGIGHRVVKDWILLHAMPVHNFGKLHNASRLDMPTSFFEEERFGQLVREFTQRFYPGESLCQI
eukprot:gene133-310_t